MECNADKPVSRVGYELTLPGFERQKPQHYSHRQLDCLLTVMLQYEYVAFTVTYSNICDIWTKHSLEDTELSVLSYRMQIFFLASAKVFYK